MESKQQQQQQSEKTSAEPEPEAEQEEAEQQQQQQQQQSTTAYSSIPVATPVLENGRDGSSSEGGGGGDDARIRRVDSLYKVKGPYPETPLSCCGDAYLKGFADVPLPPRTTRNKCSALMFSWYTPLIRLGKKRPIEQGDLWHVPTFNQCGVVTPHLGELFQQEIERGKKYPLLWALFRTRMCDFGWTAVYKVFGEGMLYALPMLTQLLLQFVEDPSAYEVWYPYVVCVGIFLVSTLHLLLFQGYIDLTTRVGMERRVAAQGLIFRKALRVDMSAVDSGQITNLMSNDCMKLQLGSLFVQNFYWQPMSAAICMILLGTVLGISALVGLAIMLVLVPLQVVVGRRLTQIRRASLGITDKRVSLVHEMIIGIRLVKVLTWERPSEAKMRHHRKKELFKLMQALAINAINFLLLDVSPLLVAVATLAVYSNISGNVMDAPTVFTALSLLVMLRKPLQMFPRVLMTTLDGWVAIKRIQRFLLLPETVRRPFEVADTPQGVTIHLENVCARWPISSVGEPDAKSRTDSSSKDSSGTEAAGDGGAAKVGDTIELSDTRNEDLDSTTRLEDINISLGPGAPSSGVKKEGNEQRTNRFGVLVGAVGSGKSSVLSLILGELKGAGLGTDAQEEQQENNPSKALPTLLVKGSVAYVPQVPFILNETLRQNILFGRSFNPQWYDRVIHACALTRDLEELPDGDMTVIGERGINISGGQKMRVALARAVYANAQIYLIDDALAAVDVHVGQHIFTHVYMGLLRNKTRLVTMHQLQYLKHADQVYCMGVRTGGAGGGLTCYVAATGTLQQLVADNPPIFAQLTSNFAAMDTEPLEEVDTALLLAEEARIDEQGGGRQTHHAELNERSTTAAAGGHQRGGKPNAEDKTVAPDATQLAADTETGDTDTTKGEENNQLQPRKAKSSSVALSDEERETGGVALQNWMLYGRSMGYTLFIVLIFTYVVSRALVVYMDFWIEEWTELLGNPNASAENSSTVVTEASSVPADGLGLDVNNQFLLYYGIIGVSATIASGFRSLAWVAVSLRAAKKLYSRMMSALMNAPMRFFDITPAGRILNRAAQDTNQVDEQLPEYVRDTLDNLFLLLGSIVTICVVIPWMILPIIPLAVIYGYIYNLYSSTAREIKRIESIARSPVFNHFEQTLQGLPSVWAFGNTGIWTAVNDYRVDEHFRSQYVSLTAKRWLNQRLDLIGTAIVTLVVLFVAAFSEGLGSAAAGLAITYALQVSKALQQFVYFASETELTMNAVERVAAYHDIPPEAAHSQEDYVLEQEAARLQDDDEAARLARELNEKMSKKMRQVAGVEEGPDAETADTASGPDDVAAAQAAMCRLRRRPKSLTSTSHGRAELAQRVAEADAALQSWPTEGAIELRDFTMRYAPHLPDVLKGLTLSIPARSKVGICGRTGSGKSSLALALFRLVECRAGSLEIDGVNIADMGLQTLRSRLGMVPQEPTLFTGTLRYNLDPWNDYDDAQIWAALEKVQIANAVREQDGGLDCKVDEGGKNWSVGQRQLLCVARVILRRVRVLVMDEASASIDAETDFLLQSMIRTEFKECTVLTIAHRLDTIMHSDLVLVLDHGEVADFGAPKNLLTRSGGSFQKLVEEGGEHLAAMVKTDTSAKENEVDDGIDDEAAQSAAGVSAEPPMPKDANNNQ